jgi:hypothetical protein
MELISVSQWIIERVSLNLTSTPRGAGERTVTPLGQPASRFGVARGVVDDGALAFDSLEDQLFVTSASPRSLNKACAKRCSLRVIGGRCRFA